MASRQSLTLFSETLPQTSRLITVHGEEDGSLLFEYRDSGSLVEKLFGSSEREFWLSLAPIDKDKLLLILLKEKFSAQNQPEEWLKAKGIVYDRKSWVSGF